MEFYVHQIYSTHRPTTMHILGQGPDASQMPNYLVKILRRTFLDRIAAQFSIPAADTPRLEQKAETIVKDCVLGDKPARRRWPPTWPSGARSSRA